MIIESPADFQGVDNCCNKLRDFLNENGLSSEIFKTELVAREAMNNAVVHGSQITGTFTFECKLDNGNIVLNIKDGGLGYRSEKENKTRIRDDNSTGRGLLIIQQYTTDFDYNDSGNEINIKIEVKK